MVEAITLTAAYILDLAIGDPRWLPHPVRIMGWGIEKMERALRSSKVRKRGSAEVKRKNLEEKLSGIFLAAVVVGTTYCLFYLINSLLITINFPLPASFFSLGILIFLIAATLATHELVRSGRAVIDAVKSNNIQEARKNLGMIVGRDTSALDERGISRAVIETLSENASDGIIAPMLYFAIGGLPLAMAYKAVNTLDSMVGYRNERYKNFGWASARLDDIANYIPARITGMLIVITAFILGVRDWGPGASSFRMMIRDGRKHLSPNSGIPEAAMAGALEVRLGGPSTYGGVLVEKPYIGEDRSGVRNQEVGANGHAPLQSQDELLNASERALSIVKLTSLLGFVIALILIYLRTTI